MNLKIHPSLKQTILQPEQNMQRKLRVNTNNLLRVTLGFIPAYANLQKRMYDQHEMDCKELEPARSVAAPCKDQADGCAELPPEASESEDMYEEARSDDELSFKSLPTAVEREAEDECEEGRLDADLRLYFTKSLPTIFTQETLEEEECEVVVKSYVEYSSNSLLAVSTNEVVTSEEEYEGEKSDSELTTQTAPTVLLRRKLAPSEHYKYREGEKSDAETSTSTRGPRVFWRKEVAENSDAEFSTYSLPSVGWSDVSEYNSDERWTDSDTNYNTDYTTDMDTSGVSGLISSSGSSWGATSDDESDASDWTTDFRKWKTMPTMEDLGWMEEYTRALFTALSKQMK